MVKRWSNGELITPQKYAQIGQELQSVYNGNIAFYQNEPPVNIAYPLAGATYTKLRDVGGALEYFPTLKLTVTQPNALVRIFGMMTAFKSTVGEYLIIDVLIDDAVSATDYRGYDLDPAVNSDGLCLHQAAGERRIMKWDVMLLGVEEGEHTFDLIYRNGASDTAGGYVIGTYMNALYVQEYGLLTINE